MITVQMQLYTTNNQGLEVSCKYDARLPALPADYANGSAIICVQDREFIVEEMSMRPNDPIVTLTVGLADGDPDAPVLAAMTQEGWVVRLVTPQSVEAKCNQ